MGSTSSPHVSFSSSALDISRHRLTADFKITGPVP